MTKALSRTGHAGISVPDPRDRKRTLPPADPSSDRLPYWKPIFCGAHRTHWDKPRSHSFSWTEFFCIEGIVPLGHLCKKFRISNYRAPKDQVVRCKKRRSRKTDLLPAHYGSLQYWSKKRTKLGGGFNSFFYSARFFLHTLNSSGIRGSGRVFQGRAITAAIGLRFEPICNGIPNFW